MCITGIATSTFCAWPTLIWPENRLEPRRMSWGCLSLATYPSRKLQHIPISLPLVTPPDETRVGDRTRTP